MRYVIATVLLATASPNVLAADAFVGAWVSRQKNICFVGPVDQSGQATWTDCSLARDELKIQKHGAEHVAELSMVFANGHQCEFSGSGKREGNRLLIVDSDNRSCPLTLEFRGNQVQLKQAEECRYNYCGARGAIDGAILFKRRAR